MTFKYGLRGRLYPLQNTRLGASVDYFEILTGSLLSLLKAAVIGFKAVKAAAAILLADLMWNSWTHSERKALHCCPKAQDATDHTQYALFKDQTWS